MFLYCVISDPKQMGQLTTYSREARELNFNKSLLPRLFELYQKQARLAAETSDLNREFAMQTMNEFGEFENPFMCSLVANYRSHPQLVNYLSTVLREPQPSEADGSASRGDKRCNAARTHTVHCERKG